MPQELRLVGFSTLEQAKAFLRERYMAEFNRKFAHPAVEKSRVFRRCGRKDLDWVFSVQSERVVGQDNTVVLQKRCLQLHKTRFWNTLAGRTVTLCEHLVGPLSVRWGPYLLTTFQAKETVAKTVPAVP